MGTDVYMKWRGMNSADKNAQITGFKAAGSVGYLRASIGMPAENRLLNDIFPEAYWLSGKPIEYDFLFNVPICIDTVTKYLKLRRRIKSIKELYELVVLRNNPRDFGRMPSRMCERYAWAREFLEFYLFGMAQQEFKKHPKVFISW